MPTESRPRAKGLKWRPRKNSPDVPIWAAPPEAVKAGFIPKTVNLSLFADRDDALIARCRTLNVEAAAFLSGRQRSAASQSGKGTFGHAIEVYQTDEESPLHTRKPSTLQPYMFYLPKLAGHIGTLRIDHCDGRDVRRWFKTWSEPSEPGGKRHVAKARMMANLLKSVVRFGVICKLPGCAVFKAILDEMEFETLKPRTAAPTVDQVIKARAAARAAGNPLRALGYAIQFETALRQYDVFGQWVPMKDPRPSTLLDPETNQKWIGPTWARIDDDLILRVTPTKTEETSEARVAFDLKLCPMVMDEIMRIPVAQRVGPIVICEGTGLPYQYSNLRRAWRVDAAAAGIPKGIWNRDLRAGGNTEGQDAGAQQSDRVKVNGHSTARTTAEIYDRGALEAHRRVARARIDHRSNSKN